MSMRRDPAAAHAPSSRPADWFELSGGALCLDFANTVSERPSAAPIERLQTYADLLDWSRRAGILTASDSRRRADQAARHPRLAARQLTEAHAAREVLYTLFATFATLAASASASVSASVSASASAAISSAPADPPRSPRSALHMSRALDAARDAFTTHLQRLLGKTTLRVRAATGRDDRRRAHDASPMEWRFANPPASADTDLADLDALLWPIWWSAAELLTSTAPGARLRQCEARDCGWLFLDHSRGHRRRWCDMRVCGNREKLRRFRAASR